MNEFFMNNSLCLSTYIIVLELIMFSIVLKKYKNYFIGLALILFTFDITYLILNGFDLERCSIITGICLILVLFSIKEARCYEL